MPRDSDQRVAQENRDRMTMPHLHDPAHRKIALDNIGPRSLTSHDYSSSTTIILFLLESAMRRMAQGGRLRELQCFRGCVSVPLLSSRLSI